MPLTLDDAKTLSPAALALAKEIGDALAPDGDGGKKVSKAEARRIFTKLGELLVVLVKDVLD